ncbi:MAG: hypothetical protein ACTSRL_22915 [Candidatus Helarchaeota archaeon]
MVLRDRQHHRRGAEPSRTAGEPAGVPAEREPSGAADAVRHRGGALAPQLHD